MASINKAPGAGDAGAQELRLLGSTTKFPNSPDTSSAQERPRDSTVERPYDPQDDITKSVAEGFRVIRERVRSGGKGWEP